MRKMVSRSHRMVVPLALVLCLALHAAPGIADEKVAKKRLACVHGFEEQGMCTCDEGWFGELCTLSTTHQLAPFFPKLATSNKTVTVRLQVDHSDAEDRPTADFDSAPDDASYCPGQCSGRGTCDVDTKKCTCEVGFFLLCCCCCCCCCDSAFFFA